MIKTDHPTLSLMVMSGLLCLVLSGCGLRSSSVGAASVPIDTKEAERLAAEAYALLSSDLPGAIETARRAVSADPGLAEAQKNLALAYYESGRAEEALAPAKAAVKLGFASHKTHFVLGKTLAAVARPEEAIRELNEAVRIKPDYDKAFFVLGLIYNRLGNTKGAAAAFDEAVRIEPENLYYRAMREALSEYVKVQQQPLANINITLDLKESEYSTAVYATVVLEALMHGNFDLLDKIADKTRTSKQILPGGMWLLRTVYGGLESPYEPNSASEYYWNNHLSLLKEWVQRKPNSVAAKVALASSYVGYGWRARGYDLANRVSADQMQLFMERVGEAKRILNSVPPNERSCPNWYSIMQKVALAEGWSRTDYDKLFNEAVTLEPSWYWFYTAKAIYLMPRWHGEEGDIRRFIDGLTSRPGGPDGQILTFIVSQTVALYENKETLLGQYRSDEQLKQGFIQLQKRHGVNNLNLNWACFVAMWYSDKAFARELLPQIKENWLKSIWTTKEPFDFVKKWAVAE